MKILPLISLTSHSTNISAGNDVFEFLFPDYNFLFEAVLLVLIIFLSLFVCLTISSFFPAIFPLLPILCQTDTDRILLNLSCYYNGCGDVNDC